MGQHAGAYFKQILKESNIELDLDQLIIADIGANIGHSVLELSRTFPHALIYCYEPVLRNFKQLKERVGKIANCKLNNYGLGVEEGTFAIGISPKREDNYGLFSLLHPNGKLSEEVIIKTTANEPKPDLVKLDIEGLEYDFLKSNEEYLQNTKVIVYEHLKTNHVNYNNHDEIPELLESFGFKLSKREGPHNRFYVRA